MRNFFLFLTFTYAFLSYLPAMDLPVPSNFETFSAQPEFPSFVVSSLSAPSDYQEPPVKRVKQNSEKATVPSILMHKILLSSDIRILYQGVDLKPLKKKIIQCILSSKKQFPNLAERINNLLLLSSKMKALYGGEAVTIQEDLAVFLHGLDEISINKLISILRIQALSCATMPGKLLPTKNFFQGCEAESKVLLSLVLKSAQKIQETVPTVIAAHANTCP